MRSGLGEKGCRVQPGGRQQQLLRTCPENWQCVSPHRQGQTVATWASGGGRGRENPHPAEPGGPAGPANQETRGAEHHRDHVQLLLEGNHSQDRGGHAGIQAGEPDTHQEAVSPWARAGLSTETSARSHSPAPTLIKDVFVYMPHTISRDVGKETCSLVGHSRPRK